MNVLERYPIVWRNSRTGTYSNTLKPETPYVIVTIRATRVKEKDKYFKIFKFDDFLKESVEMLDLKTRSSNALRRNGINTMEDLIENYDRLSHMRCLGTGSVSEIHTQFIKFYSAYLTHIGKEKLLDQLIYENE